MDITISSAALPWLLTEVLALPGLEYMELRTLRCWNTFLVERSDLIILNIVTLSVFNFHLRIPSPRAMRMKTKLV